MSSHIARLPWYPLIMRRPRLVYVVTHPVTADVLLRGQLAFMRDSGFDVTVIASPGPELSRVEEREGVRTIALPLAREPHVRDPQSLGRLVRLLRSLAPDIVNASTPKAGLLGTLAARVTNVPIRVYAQYGLRLETATGPLRTVLAATERLASACATDVVCVSESLRRVVLANGYASPRKTVVLGAGSSNGVDVARFRRDDALRAVGRGLLATKGVGATDPVVLFVGRFVADKGIRDVVRAFSVVRAVHPAAKLVMIGGDFADEKLDAASARALEEAPGVVHVGRIDDLAPYYAAGDVLAFPSYREGFPNVPLEASATELPVVGYRATGTVDAVVDGTTGRIVDVGDAHALGVAVAEYLGDAELARRHGRAGRARAVVEFSTSTVWEAWRTFYRSRLVAAP